MGSLTRALGKNPSPGRTDAGSFARRRTKQDHPTHVIALRKLFVILVSLLRAIKGVTDKIKTECSFRNKPCKFLGSRDFSGASCLCYPKNPDPQMERL